MLYGIGLGAFTFFFVAPLCRRACAFFLLGFSQVPRRLTDLEQISAGAMGGALSGLICGPTELLMIQQQRSGLSLLATPGNIVGISGVTGKKRPG